MTAPAVQTSPQLHTELHGGVFVFSGDTPPPGGRPRRVADIANVTAYGSRSAPVLVDPTEPTATKGTA